MENLTESKDGHDLNALRDAVTQNAKHVEEIRNAVCQMEKAVQGLVDASVNKAMDERWEAHQSRITADKEKEKNDLEQKLSELRDLIVQLERKMKLQHQTQGCLFSAGFKSWLCGSDGQALRNYRAHNDQREINGRTTLLQSNLNELDAAMEQISCLDAMRCTSVISMDTPHKQSPKRNRNYRAVVRNRTHSVRHPPQISESDMFCTPAASTFKSRCRQNQASCA